MVSSYGILHSFRSKGSDDPFSKRIYRSIYSGELCLVSKFYIMRTYYFLILLSLFNCLEFTELSLIIWVMQSNRR
jgi:hypothetical protein